MRKFVRNQILELLSTVWEGIKKAKTLEPQTAESVLVHCYLAIQTVEQTLHDGLSQYALKKYIDLSSVIKEILEEINIGIVQDASIAESTKKLKFKLKQFRKLLLEEKEIKLEVVFFPYKVSMWDSLESIWFAARDDENCDAYVVPIPYYDRLPNGEFGTMHYEGNLYPEYVPIVNWCDYDTENRHPDIIYVHTPYDARNYVTSIHSDFYCERLRDLTQMLVHVPYFVTLDKVSDNISSFATQAGCIYAHKVIVQSEGLRRIYAKYMKAVIGNQFGKP